MTTKKARLSFFFTSFVFKKFSKQFGQGKNYAIKRKRVSLRHHKDVQYNKQSVIWNGKVATCSCIHFEFVGILCRHILSVLLHKDYFTHAFLLLTGLLGGVVKKHI